MCLLPFLRSYSIFCRIYYCALLSQLIRAFVCVSCEFGDDMWWMCLQKYILLGSYETKIECIWLYHWPLFSRDQLTRSQIHFGFYFAFDTRKLYLVQYLDTLEILIQYVLSNNTTHNQSIGFQLISLFTALFALTSKLITLNQFFFSCRLNPSFSNRTNAKVRIVTFTFSCSFCLTAPPHSHYYMHEKMINMLTS